MTKEELKKEAEEKAGIYFDSLDYDHGDVSDTPFSAHDVFVAYKKGALDFAEPREKRIAELEDKLANADYQLEGRDNEIRELEKQLKAEHTKGEIDFVNMHCNSSCKKVKELEEKIKHLTKHLEPQSMSALFEQVEEEVKQKQRIEELEAQVEKMKKYGKLLQDICVVLGNDNFMVAVQLESVVKKLWDVSEEKEGLKMVEDIEKRLLEIKPQEWAEITKWEMIEK